MMFMTAKETGIAIQSDKSFANSGTNSHMSPNDVYRSSKAGEEPFNQNELMKLQELHQEKQNFMNFIHSKGQYYPGN